MKNQLESPGSMITIGGYGPSWFQQLTAPPIIQPSERSNETKNSVSNSGNSVQQDNGRDNADHTEYKDTPAANQQ